MDLGVAIPMSVGPSALDDDELWDMNLTSRNGIESGFYPVREGEPDCSYYIRTGLCRFGNSCRFNHPTNRKLAIATARMRGEYPERIGQQECQYYLKTGTCKFGATCKFHHPRDKAGIEGRVSLNALGYPLRPNELECVYYLRTGQCKFGSTCKFHHPQPSNMMVSYRGSPVYPPGQQSYAGGIANWPLSRASFIPTSRWQGPSNYAPLILPQGVVSVQGWNSYNGQLGSLSPEQQETARNSQHYATSRQSEAAIGGSQGTYPSYRSGSLAVGYYALQSENVFPERPGQPECQFYMKTGDCKYGAVCRFHHPRERLIPPPDCVLSPMGLPLRTMRDWLDLSLNHSVPSSLLILSRAFSVSGKLKPEEAVQATLSSLPDEVVDTVGITSLPSEDSVSERRRKLEFLEMQEEMIKEEEEKEEQAKKKESLEKQKDIALEEMVIPTAQEADELAKAKTFDKQEQLSELSRALAVLASASSVSREREEFLRLVKKEIELYNRMVEKEGTETEEAAKNAYRAAREEGNDTEEKTVDAKVSSALINRVDAMLQKLEKEIDDVDAKIGDRWRLLDKDYDGKVSPEEVASAAMYLKDTLDKEGIQELISNLSKDADGKIRVEDILKLASQSKEEDETGDEAVKD